MTTNTDVTSTDGATFARAWQDWHTARVHGLTEDTHGWLSVVALDWLAAGQTRTYADGRVSFARQEGSLRVRAISPDGTIDVDLGSQAPQFFEFDDVRYELLLRANVDAEPGTAAAAAPAGTSWVGVRVRDPHAELLAATTDVPAFPADPAWAVTARFTPGPTSEIIDTAVPGLHVAWPLAGTVEFELDGRTHRLKAGGDPGTGLNINFHDATNGAADHAATSAWRAVSTGPVAEDGTVSIDFNRATNFPAGFTVHATCPAPPVGNTLDVAVTAGEQVPWRP